ncbi:MAG: dTMP kinase [Bacillota bacterium]
MKGLLITVEGPEGAGKTTQLKLLASDLEELGYEVLSTREPGGTKVGDRIRSILLDSQLSNLEAKTELLLYAASRAQHVTEVIKPALKAGKVVLCDRFIDATMAYQGYGRKLDQGLIKQLNEIATAGLEPDLTLLLDIVPEVGLRRAKKSSQELDGSLVAGDRIEQEKLNFHQQVREGYLELAARFNERFVVIDANDDQEEVHRQLIATVKGRLDVN